MGKFVNALFAGSLFKGDKGVQEFLFLVGKFLALLQG